MEYLFGFVVILVIVFIIIISIFFLKWIFKLLKFLFNFFKKRKLLLLAIILSLSAIRYFTLPKLHIVSNFYKTSYEVPKWIIFFKSCKKYKKFVHSIAKPMFVPSDNCPWQKVEPIGYFTIGDIEFKIPRDYIYIGSRDPDGKTDAMRIIIKYPEMTPGHPDGDETGNLAMRKHNLVTKIAYRDQYTKCLKENKEQKKEEPCFKLGKIPEPTDYWQKIGFNEELGMEEYVEKDYLHSKYIDKSDRLYLKNDLPLGQYLIICTFSSKVDYCKSFFAYDKDIAVYYRFNRKFQLKNHLHIRQKMIEKMDEFSGRKSKINATGYAIDY